MKNRYELFVKVITTLNEASVLQHLVLIGSWCLYVYRNYFNNAPEIPLLRTTDIDFLIPRPLRMKGEINVHEILKNLGFDEQFSSLTGQIKYVHPQLEVEFLTPELGKGNSRPFDFKRLHLSAQQLRYLTLLQQYTLTISVEGIQVTVPQPAAFVLHKFLLSVKRSDGIKQEKDLRTAIELGEFLLSQKDESQRLVSIFNSLPARWKKVILSVTEKDSPSIYKILIQG